MSHKPKFHPVTSVYEGVFNSASGTLIDLYNPLPETMHISDIAGALSKVCRFGGHVRKFYSVAQHSCLVASLVPAPLMLEALMHDATEAYVGDVIKPLKVMLGVTYDVVETRFEKAIAVMYRLAQDKAAKDIIKKCDEQALYLEHEAFQKGNLRPLQYVIRRQRLHDDFRHAWPPDHAEVRFLTAYDIVKRLRK